MKLSIKDVETNYRYVIETSFGDENYFKLIGQPLIQGDNFAMQTKQYRDQVLIINETFADKLALNGNVIGKKLDFSNDGSNVFTVIGIVKGILAPGASDIPMRMYAPASTLAPKFLLQFERNQKLTRDQLITSLHSISGLLTIAQYKSLSDSFNQVLQVERITLVSTVAMIIISLSLASVGIYGILSFSTQMRRFEIGTRLAVGAKRSDMIKLVVKDNINTLIIGILSSVVILVILSLTFNERVNDYLSWQLLPIFLLSIACISMIAFIACYLPLRQYINKPVIRSLKGSE